MGGNNQAYTNNTENRQAGGKETLFTNQEMQFFPIGFLSQVAMLGFRSPGVISVKSHTSILLNDLIFH